MSSIWPDLADEDGQSGGGAQGPDDDNVAGEGVDAAEDGADDGDAGEDEAGRVDGHEDDALEQRGGLRVRGGESVMGARFYVRETLRAGSKMRSNRVTGGWNLVGLISYFDLAVLLRSSNQDGITLQW